jgi:4-hydroxy-2-oxoheptanedioate aldolase
VRAELRMPTTPAEADAAVLCLPMIETAEGLANVEAIAATPGVDGLYIGPSDLRLGLGGASPDDPALDATFAEAVERIRAAAAAAGIVVGSTARAGRSRRSGSRPGSPGSASRATSPTSRRRAGRTSRKRSVRPRPPS